jgi:hypothetical protein
MLKTLGVSAAVSPFVPLLQAAGQTTLYPKRLVLFYTPHGTILDSWKPTGTGSSFTLSHILAPLSAHRDKLVVLSGVNMPDVGVGAPHTKGLPLLWTGSKLLEDNTFTRADGSGGNYYGWNSGPSVDQYIAQKLGFDTAFRSIELGVRTGGNTPACRMIYAAAQKPLEPAIDPGAAFDRLFVGRSDLSNRERRSGIELIRAELARLSPKIASAERPKLEAHLDALQSIDTRLARTSAACAGPTLGTLFNPFNNEKTPELVDQQSRLLASALACDLTRVASFQYSLGDNDDFTYPWLGITGSGHHTLSHASVSDTSAKTKLISIYTWYAKRFAYLLDQLAAIPEGDGTLLDNCIVVWGSELATGSSHSFASTPFVVAGGGQNTIATGQHLDFAGKVQHNRLLVSLCRAFGLSDVKTYGNTDNGSGPLAGLLR